MSPEALRHYRQRWQTLAELERAELRELSVAQRWQQLAVILNFGRHLPHVSEVFQSSDTKLWLRLRRAHEQTRCI